MIERQRFLTPDEYAALGYVQREDFDPSIFDVKPDKPLTEPLLDIAYRADEKEEYYLDFTMMVVKLGYTLTTGGIMPAAQSTLGYVISKLS